MYDNKLDNTPMQRAFDKAAREENLDPRGLPMDMIARMEATIRANPDEYPEINAALGRIEAKHAVVEVDFCGCTNTELERGKTCGQPSCPNIKD